MDISRNNQSTWGWQIAAYLFSAGMGAGAYSFSCYLKLVPSLDQNDIALRGMWIGTVVTAFSVSFLILDLGKPIRFLRVLVNVAHSWLSRGAVILTTFCILALATIFSGEVTALVWLSLALAIAVATYTGILLGTMLSRPLWNNSLLPVIFLTSALSTGIGLLDVGGTITAIGNSSTLHAIESAITNLRWIHVLLLVAELIMLYFYLNLSYFRSEQAVHALIKGNLRNKFWLGIIGIGIIIPIIVLTSTQGLHGATESLLLIVSDLCVLLGGFMLRRLVLYVGTRNAVELGVRFVIRSEI